jgi:hypothetical protein
MESVDSGIHGDMYGLALATLAVINLETISHEA